MHDVKNLLHRGSFYRYRFLWLVSLLLIFSCSSEKPSSSSGQVSSAGPGDVPLTSQTDASAGSLSLQISPEGATRNSTIYSMPHGFSLPDANIEWFVNRIPVQSASAHFQGSDTKKGDTVQAKATIEGKEIFSNTIQIENAPDNPWQWTPAGENMVDTDSVIVLQYRDTLLKTDRLLITNGTAFHTTFNDLLASRPARREDPSNIVYGLAPGAAGTPRMPFNRADYYISRPADISPRCAPAAGILYKATLQHATGTFTVLPLLDCVIDMQVTFLVDANEDGVIDSPPFSDSLVGWTAAEIRNRVREVRVYILAQEGQKDPTYDFSEGGTREYLYVTETYGPDSQTINFANLKTLIGDPEYKYYRWKIYAIAVTPNNLR